MLIGMIIVMLIGMLIGMLIEMLIIVHKSIPYNAKNSLQKSVLNNIATYINPGLAT